MNKLLFASLFTLTILTSFVFSIVILIMLYTDTIDVGFAIGATIVINFTLWLIGPFITDIINKWFYKVRFVSQRELQQLHPEVFEIITKVSSEYHFNFPKVGIIPDQNPTAFTYGSARYNARIVLTEGIFHFLNPQEVQAVVAHELGHIVNRDFIIMMIASTLVQILYEIYATLRRARGRRSGNTKIIALGAYVLYIVGVYLVYYLSRTREYLADGFAARVTQAGDLASALVKIAYGIVQVEDSASSKRLLESTRHLGITDVKNAKHVGVMTYITNQDPKAIEEVMVFDKVSPWATIIELSSTHPLTGKRLEYLSALSKHYGQAFSFDIEGAVQRLNIDKSKLYSGFYGGVVIYFLPMIFGLLAFIFLSYGWIPAAVGVGILIKALYRYPRGTPIATTILNEMRNPYASPMRGKNILLNGKVIGRGIPGYIFSEDMMFQDSTGLTFLDYVSFFGGIGNLFFALGKLKKLFNIPAQAAGWFFRGMGSSVSLQYLKTDQETVRSHPLLWNFVIAFVLIVISIFIA